MNRDGIRGNPDNGDTAQLSETAQSATILPTPCTTNWGHKFGSEGSIPYNTPSVGYETGQDREDRAQPDAEHGYRSLR